jgi:hypothetical protein
VGQNEGPRLTHSTSPARKWRARNRIERTLFDGEHRWRNIREFLSGEVRRTSLPGTSCIRATGRAEAALSSGPRTVL